MRYEYGCSNLKCGNVFDEHFRLGSAPLTAKCPKCRGVASRRYTTAGFSVKGGSISVPSGSKVRRRMGDEMLARNRAAGDRMRGRVPPVRRVATDYGSGDVRAVEK